MHSFRAIQLELDLYLREVSAFAPPKQFKRISGYFLGNTSFADGASQQIRERGCAHRHESLVA